MLLTCAKKVNPVQPSVAFSASDQPVAFRIPTSCSWRTCIIILICACNPHWCCPVVNPSEQAALLVLIKHCVMHPLVRAKSTAHEFYWVIPSSSIRRKITRCFKCFLHTMHNFYKHLSCPSVPSCHFGVCVLLNKSSHLSLVPGLCGRNKVWMQATSPDHFEEPEVLCPPVSLLHAGCVSSGVCVLVWESCIFPQWREQQHHLHAPHKGKRLLWIQFFLSDEAVE